MFRIVALFVVIVFCNAKSIANEENEVLKREFNAPDFCHGLQCPKYDVLKKTDDYELRQYSQSQWASALIVGVDYDQAVKEGFMKLFRYISGNNEAGKKIPMTAPVATIVQPGQGPACASNFTVNFMVPFDLQGHAPKPKDAGVNITTAKPIKIYIRTFKGFAKGQDFVQEAAVLADKIGDSSLYYGAPYITAGYNSPFDFRERHNEIGLISRQ